MGRKKKISLMEQFIIPEALKWLMENRHLDKEATMWIVSFSEIATRSERASDGWVGGYTREDKNKDVEKCSNRFNEWLKNRENQDKDGDVN